MLTRSLALSLLLFIAAPAALLAQTPTPTGPGDRLGFYQQTTAAELPLLSWEASVDGAVTGLVASVNCTVDQADPARYLCVGNYPAMTPGTHNLTIVTIRTEPSGDPGTPPLVLRSPPSAPFALNVRVSPNTATGLHNIRSGSD